jgi:hypothetical protein
MGRKTGKRKVPTVPILAVLAALTFGLSAAGVFPANWVENAYAGPVYPVVSRLVAWIADAVPFSWLDAAILAAIAILIYSVKHRSARLLVGAVSIAYLWSFWTWGLNYHRVGLEDRLDLKEVETSGDEIDQFAAMAAAELNRLWPIVSEIPANEQTVGQLASSRVQRVVADVGAAEWPAAERMKRSIMADWWFRFAGVDGMFNPLVHEPIVSSGLLSFELPFVTAHELAHVRGIPNEGDANLVAAFATIGSNDPTFQYSGWFHLWLYLRNSERDEFLEAGPRRDLQLFYERLRSQRVEWVSNVQSAVLDWYLKSNDVEEGVQSYARFVTLTIAAHKRGLLIVPD